MKIAQVARRPFVDRMLGLIARGSAVHAAVDASPRTVRKVAVLLPVPYRGGSFRGFKSVAKMLLQGSRLAGSPIEVVAGFPAGHYDLRTEFTDLVDLGISLRTFEWQTLDRRTLERALAFVSDTVPRLDRYHLSIVPDDGINHFLDCDFWLVVSDRLSLPVAPLRPRGHVIYDYIQQIRPDVFPASFDDGPFVFNVRQAQFVLCTTPFTAEAAVNYGGVDRDRVHLMDMEIEVDLDEMAAGGQIPRTKRPYILWPTNTSPHKNHTAALDALDLYFGKYGGKFDVICTGLNTHWFDLDAEALPQHQDPAIKPVRDRFARSRLLRKRLKVVGELSEADYFTALANATFLFHPALVDNGTYAVTEAAWFGIPSLSHDYPAIRWMDERFALALSYCDARDPDEMARALIRMEQDGPLRRSLLPSRDQLRRHSWKSHARTFWSRVGGLMENAP